MLEERDFRNKSRRVKGTNITVQKLTPSGETHQNDLSSLGRKRQRTAVAESNAAMHIFCNIHSDPQEEVRWFEKTFRPERMLIHPSEAYLQGLKKLRPALHFNTFDVVKAKGRRVSKQQQDQAAAKKRREALVAPTAALKAALNSKRLPPGSAATDAEQGLLMRGKKNKRIVETHIAKMRAKRKGFAARMVDEERSAMSGKKGKKSKKEDRSKVKKSRRDIRTGDAL